MRVCARARARARGLYADAACLRAPPPLPAPRSPYRSAFPHLAEGLPGREEVLLAAADEHVAQRALLVRRELQRHPIN